MNTDVTTLRAAQVRKLALDEAVILVTPLGLSELARQAEAYDAEAKDLKKKLGESAAEYPDLRENATFDFLSAQLEHHLPKLQADLRVQMMKAQQYHEQPAAGKVLFGTICELENQAGQVLGYWLAGPVEASANLECDGISAVSYRSPIGRAIWGVKVGDTVEVRLPSRGNARVVNYRIVSSNTPVYTA